MLNKDQVIENIGKVIDNVPSDWLKMTTHRLDIYNEKLAKTEFLSHLCRLFDDNCVSNESLSALPTAFDYVRLGHQLSSFLEWAIGEINGIKSDQVITFASKVMPLMSVMRFDTTRSRQTHLYFDSNSELARDLFSGETFKTETLKAIYNYNLTLHETKDVNDVKAHEDGTVVFVSSDSFEDRLSTNENIDVFVNLHKFAGAALIILNSKKNEKAGISKFVGEVQHVRRRESIAVTPTDCYSLLNEMLGQVPSTIEVEKSDVAIINKNIEDNTGSSVPSVLASSGLSVQYAIFMGFVDKCRSEHPDKKIKFVIPPNCYGGTNDQARRIAAIDSNVEILDIPVDGDQDMIKSLDIALEKVAKEDALGIVLAEIPTNPRVEVPDMDALGEILRKERKTGSGNTAQPIVFTIDQTFCPNVKVLHGESPLRGVQNISYVSCSKFPSGGECTGGYATGNEDARELMSYVKKHLEICDNQATGEQHMLIAKNYPSMGQRIQTAFENTDLFVKAIKKTLPDAKLNFVSDEVSAQGFTPSVFSLELPAEGNSPEERESNRREKNIRLIQHMVKENPSDCKHCVSYGQLKGSYWTIPATSTQGTTKEADKDYIVRIALGPEIDVERLIKTFNDFFS